jgi:hypothetical protein
VFSAGHSVVGVHDIVGAATVIHRTHDEYRDARRQTLALLGAALTARSEAGP